LTVINAISTGTTELSCLGLADVAMTLRNIAYDVYWETAPEEEEEDQLDWNFLFFTSKTPSGYIPHKLLLFKRPGFGRFGIPACGLST